MSYGVNTTWASQPSRARGAAKSKRRTTKTASRSSSGSARRVKKKSSGKKRRRLQPQDYHAQSIGKPPHDWGGTLAQWQAYRTDKTGKAPGYWL